MITLPIDIGEGIVSSVHSAAVCATTVVVVVVCEKIFSVCRVNEQKKKIEN